MRNKEQSRPIITARKNAIRRFTRHRDAIKREWVELEDRIEEAFELMNEVFAAGDIREDQGAEVIWSFAFDCFRFGRAVERRENFERTREWMKNRIISKQRLIGYLTKKTNSKISLSENVELFDVSFGTGYGRRLVIHKILSTSLKRQLRNTLAKRLRATKVKPPLKF